jgi:hypothetical protein
VHKNSLSWCPKSSKKPEINEAITRLMHQQN